MNISGFSLFLLATAILLIERFGGTPISGFLGRRICGDEYLKEVNGILTEAACGFDYDMYLSIVLLGMIATGLIMIMLARRGKSS